MGKGGEGSVYLTINESAYQFWAIKVIEKEDCRKKKMELELWKHFSHPNLPSVVDVIEKDTKIIMVMDYIKGKTLAELLQEKGPISEKQALLWAIQICNVLSYLHEQQPAILYGDLKPDNMICRADKSLVLVDFGTLQAQGVIPNEERHRCYGTRGYAAPEQYEPSAKVDIRTDIYCMGATLFHLLTGVLPVGKSFRERKEELKRKRISSEFQKVVCKCMEVQPENRFSSCEASANALKRVKKKRWILTGLSAAAGVVIAAAGMTMTEKKAEDVSHQIYEAYLENAKYNIYEEQINSCISAINLKPDRAKAYLQLIDVFLSDDILTEAEDQRLRQILKEISSTYNEENEDCLKADISGYISLSYRLGMAYWYCYEGTGGKNFSSKWFWIVAEAPEEILENKSWKIRASVYAKIGSYHDEIRRKNHNGDAQISYAQYWNDVISLYRLPIAEQDHIITALRLWEEIVVQIYNLAEQFLAEGITLKVQEQILADVEVKLAQIVPKEYQETEWQLKKNILEHLVLAKERLERMN